MSSDPSPAQRVAANEMAGRDANERIDPAPEAGWDLSLVDRNCECGSARCDAQLQLTVAEYEGLRQDGRRFAVVHGHVIPDVDSVVEQWPRYTVVEKDGEAAEIAEARNPRS